MKKMYVISGCNGAGKTTTSFTLLPELLECNNFVNADNIAYGLSPLNPKAADFQAGRIMLDRIKYLIDSKETFAFETTLTTLSYKNIFIEAKKNKYEITLLFIWLNNHQLAIQRVNERKNHGGHYVSEEIITRRYYKGLVNFFTIFNNISDNWYICDNSYIVPEHIASRFGNAEIIIKNNKTYNIILNTYDNNSKT
jgi:predicted ABC-type ATPase